MAWLQVLIEALKREEPACLVTVARIKGSAPREAGAAMVVTPETLEGSIGGGQLEHQALRQARRGLAEHPLPAAAMETVALGPQRDQCCGGKVWLAFEWFEPADLSATEQLVGAPAIVSVLDGTRRLPQPSEHSEDNCRLEEVGGVPRLLRGWRQARSLVYLFGAGHVGRAVVNALAPLPFEIAWIDSRPEVFPEFLPENVVPRPALEPLSEITRAAPGAYFLVMTHEHDLDEQICEAILCREDFAYLGLIGSETKARRFRMRLNGRGVPGVDRLICPIGIAGINSKAPAIIAASVAADLLQRSEHRPTDGSRKIGSATA